jgi:hypothetical protein
MTRATNRPAWRGWLRGVTFGLLVPCVMWAPIVAAYQPDEHELPACRTEDSTACRWDGGSNGGRPFTATSDGTVTFANGETDERVDNR